MSVSDDSIAIVIAHYDPQGIIRRDLLELVRDLSGFAHRLVFVSTSLTASAANSLPEAVHTIVRENHGYDFYSYKTGIDALGDLHCLSRMFLLNSSFICVDRAKLMQRFFSVEHRKIDVFGLTQSNEVHPHLQSFLLSFGARCLRSEQFTDWWARMVPIDSRQDVIKTYELGLSAYLAECGFLVGSAYVPSVAEKTVALFRSMRRLKFELDPAALNPMHFYWDFILEHFGIAKIELVERNPFGLNLKRLRLEL